MAERRKVGNLLAVPLLTCLTERPMHPYEMAALLRERGKDASVDIHWGSLYTVVNNLRKHGFIESVGTSRQGRKPERTVYRITEAGRAELKDWLRELVGVPEREYTRLEAGLSDVGVLPPDEVHDLLQSRLTALQAEIADQQRDLDAAAAMLPRVFLVEAEYHLAMCRAEADWITGLLTEMTEGTLSGLREWRAFHEHGQVPPDLAAWQQANAPAVRPETEGHP